MKNSIYLCNELIEKFMTYNSGILFQNTYLTV